jgi:flavin reductase (DIM6/NTAB) family NADH-FMN oxidoreductase RutF
MDEPEFRRVLGHFATGVAVVAARRVGDGGRDRPAGSPRGLTASAITSVSLDPPLVLVCVDHTADTHDVIVEAEAFSISVLREDQEGLARRFAGPDSDNKFDGVAYRPEVTGAPVLDNALAWIDCRLWARYDGGDHTIFVGEVVAADADEGPPLIYFRGGYGRVAP